MSKERRGGLSTPIALYCKVTSRQTSRNVTRRKNVSPWYDGECEKQRKIYNTLRNQYGRSQDDDDKLERNDAKLEYVKLCKIKTKNYRPKN